MWKFITSRWRRGSWTDRRRVLFSWPCDPLSQVIVQLPGFSAVAASGRHQGIESPFPVVEIPFIQSFGRIIFHFPVRMHEPLAGCLIQIVCQVFISFRQTWDERCDGRVTHQGDSMSVFLFHLYKTSFSFFLIIKEAGREVTQSYVGGTKRIFLVFFICMNWRPKRRRQGSVRACAGESSRRSLSRRWRQKRM